MPMRKLLLMRHAKSSWKDLSLPDHERPLNKRGKRDAPRMGNFMESQGITIDAILCSTAKRARATAQGFLTEYTFEGESFYIDDLYHANHETYIAILNQMPDEVSAAMIIGHNPTMDYYLEISCDVYDHMTTAAIAEINFPIDNWTQLNEATSGELLNLWKPREIT